MSKQLGHYRTKPELEAERARLLELARDAPSQREVEAMFWEGFAICQADEAVEALEAAHRDGDTHAAAANAFFLGGLQVAKRFVQAGLCELQAHEHRRVGGNKQKISKAEMKKQLQQWDKALEGHSKKTLAMRQLRIPKSTYYKYRTLVGKT